MNDVPAVMVKEDAILPIVFVKLLSNLCHASIFVVLVLNVTAVGLSKLKIVSLLAKLVVFNQHDMAKSLYVLQFTLGNVALSFVCKRRLFLFVSNE